MLRPAEPYDPNSQAERILAIGDSNSGKTTGWLNIAWWADKTNSPARFFVIDSDKAAGRMLTGRYEGLRDRVFTYPVFEWEEYVNAAKDIEPQLTHDDWVVVDFMGSSWPAVQDWYIESIYGVESADYFMDKRRQMKDPKGLDGWKDWQYINREFRRFVEPLVFKYPGHRYFTALVDNLQESDAKELRGTYAKFGVKPRGQKHMTAQAHTVLLFQQAGDRWVINTVKDRERERLVGAEIKHFARDYLKNVAGWSL